MDLLENATDSLSEALRQYETAVNGEPRAYKFAILHYAHFLELLFKHYVAKAHPLLIYKNPFAANLRKTQTIGLWEAIQFLRNEGKEISEEFFDDMEWLKSLRNDIEHHTFDLNIPEARRAIGRLTRATIAFNQAHDGIALEDYIDPARFAVLEELADELRAAIAHARLEAQEEAGEDDTYDCELCHTEGTAVLRENAFRCKLCEDADELTDCCVCGIEMRASEGSVWNDDHAPHTDYICYGCEGRITHM